MELDSVIFYEQKRGIPAECAAHRIYSLMPRKCNAHSQMVFEDGQYLHVLKIFATWSLHRSVNFGEVLPGAGWGSALLWAACGVFVHFRLLYFGTLSPFSGQPRCWLGFPALQRREPRLSGAWVLQPSRARLLHPTRAPAAHCRRQPLGSVRCGAESFSLLWTDWAAEMLCHWSLLLQLWTPEPLALQQRQAVCSALLAANPQGCVARRWWMNSLHFRRCFEALFSPALWNSASFSSGRGENLFV